MAMNFRLLRPLASGVHPEAAAWRTAVIANGGGTPSAVTMRAVSKFCADIDKANIRSKFYRLNLFAGPTGNLNAALVPLFRGPSRTGTQYGDLVDTNVGGLFVSGDYVETGAGAGLNANGNLNKRLTTGFKLNQLPSAVTDNHIGAFAFAHTPTAVNHWMIGSRDSSAAIGYMRTGNSAGGTWYVNNGTATSHAYGGQHPSALYLASRRTATNLEIYENSTERNFNNGTSSTAPYDGDNWIFSVNNQGSWPGGFPFRLGGYTFGVGMTAGEVSSLATAWANFNAALSRT